MKIGPLHLRLAGHLLSMAAEEFGNHGCNDWDWPDWFPADEREAFVRAMEKANNPATDRADEIQESVDMYAGNDGGPPDFWVMGFLADELTRAGGGTP